MPSTGKSLWRGLKLTGGKIAMSNAAVDAAVTVEGDSFLSGLPRTADGSLAVTVSGLPSDIPAPPVSGTRFLKSVDGVIGWYVS